MLTENASDAVDGVGGLFEEERPGVLTVGAAASLLALSRALAAVFGALDLIAGRRAGRTWWRERARALGMAAATVLAAAALLALVVLGPLLGRGQQVADSLGAGTGFALAWSVLRVPFTFVVLVAWAALLFSVSGVRRGSWRLQLPGAVVVAALWLAASVGVRAFRALAAGTNQVFGVFGGSLILLLWLYLLAPGLLVGWELNAVFDRTDGGAG